MKARANRLPGGEEEALGYHRDMDQRAGGVVADPPGRSPRRKREESVQGQAQEHGNSESPDLDGHLHPALVDQPPLSPEFEQFRDSLMVEHNMRRVRAIALEKALGHSFDQRLENAFDVENEIWLEVCEEVARWPPGRALPSDPERWLVGLAYNRANEILRKQLGRRDEGPAVGARRRPQRPAPMGSGRAREVPLEDHEAPDEDMEERIINRLDAQEKLRYFWQHLWPRLNQRQRLGLFRALPVDQQQLFPPEVASRMRLQSEEVLWSSNAGHKAVFDARQCLKRLRAQAPRELASLSA